MKEAGLQQIVLYPPIYWVNHPVRVFLHLLQVGSKCFTMCRTGYLLFFWGLVVWNLIVVGTIIVLVVKNAILESIEPVPIPFGILSCTSL